MAKDTKNAIVIDDTEYNFDEMTDRQKLLVNHLLDLERKISSAQFNLDQLAVGKDAFMQMLKKELEVAKEPEVAE
jgi:hypothetical protein